MGNKFKNSVAWSRRYLSLTLIVVIAFVLFVLFFNENSVMKSIEYTQQINELKRQIDNNRDSFELYRSLNHSLETDPETMERIVRERYHMQRENEDVYIVE